MKKISLFIALVIAALLSLGGQSAAMAFEHGPTLYTKAQDHRASILYFEPADKPAHELRKIGVTDTVFMVSGYIATGGPVPLIDNRVGVIRNKMSVSGYKDRPGWL